MPSDFILLRHAECACCSRTEGRKAEAEDSPDNPVDDMPFHIRQSHIPTAETER